jgi:hypothetical protein
MGLFLILTTYRLDKTREPLLFLLLVTSKLFSDVLDVVCLSRGENIEIEAQKVIRCEVEPQTFRTFTDDQELP